MSSASSPFAAGASLGVPAPTGPGRPGGGRGLALPLPTWSLSQANWPFYYPLLGLLVLTVAGSVIVRPGKLRLGRFALQGGGDKAARPRPAPRAGKMSAVVPGRTVPWGRGAAHTQH